MEHQQLCDLLQEAMDFTHAYQRDSDLVMREVNCLKAQFPAILLPIAAEDLFVGYYREPLVGYRYSWDNEKSCTGYYADIPQLEEIAADTQLSEEDRACAAQLLEFWRENRTMAKIQKTFPELVERDLFRVAEIYIRLSEINLDFDMLLQLGLPGLREEIGKMYAQDGKPARKGELEVLDLMAEILQQYADQAKVLAQTAEPVRCKQLQRMAEMLQSLTERAPDSFYAALQLAHLVVMMTGVDNFARMDVYMGDFLVKDLEAGVLSREEALEILVNLYDRWADLFPTSGRIIIGGQGRRNAKNADQMALLLLDAAKVVHKSAPTLCLRLYDGMDPVLWEKACDDLEAGCSYPLLYNDVVNIPGRMRAHRVSRSEAEQYIMSNCGEYGIWGHSIHSPNAAISYAKLLELALFNGVDQENGQQIGLQTGDAAQFTSFEMLLEAFQKQATYFIERTAQCLPRIYEGAAMDSNNLLESMLHHNSFEEGVGILAGAQYRIIDIETHAIVLVADSLLAVRKVVFEDRKMTMQHLLDALKANFAGYEKERAWLLHAPKFGNNHPEADAMARKISDFIYETTCAQADKLKVHASTASQITVDGYVIYGKNVGATPDGRLAGQPLTNSMNPTNGCDRSGITALLWSMAGVDSSLSGGQVAHLKLAPDAFGEKKRAATTAMLAAYFEAGGGEISIYTVRQEDLIDALEHPEKHQNLMVRIGGYNARFVTLSRELQEEMIARNAYVR